MAPVEGNGTVSATEVSWTTPLPTGGDSSSEKPGGDSAYYALVPLTILIILFLSAAVVLLIIRKRRLDELRHTLMPLYSFDPADEGEADWEAELLDSTIHHPAASALNPAPMARKGYRSVDSPDASISGPFQV